jgi:mRNA-degrading endonuclease toxin of MazEF toxin-antitoxin module
VSPIRLPRLGSVAWAELEDANGFVKVRPVAVVTPTAQIALGKPVRVVAITTRLPTPLPDDHVLLPWDRQGKARSGLRRPCAAVANWQAEIPVDKLQPAVGILPPIVIGALLEKIAAILAPPSSATPVPVPAQPSVQPSDVSQPAMLPTAEFGEGDGVGEIA